MATGIKITKEILDGIEKYAAIGQTVAEICHNLGFGERTFYRKEKLDSRIRQALKRGRAKGIAQVENALFTAAVGGNTTAMIFFLKNMKSDKWKDRVPELPGEDRAPPVAIRVQVIDGTQPEA